MYKVIPQLEKVPNEDVELLTQEAAAKLLHIDALKLRHAMNQWVKSSGRMGLAFVQVGARRRLRRGALRKWLAQLEEMTMLGYL